MSTQNISRKNLQIIYSSVCNSWQTKIENILKEQLFDDNIAITNALIKQAYSEADKDKRKIIERYFNVDFLIENYQKINNFDDILKLSNSNISDIIAWPNPKNKKQISQNGLAKLQLIEEVYNQDDPINWDNPNQRKYYIWWRRDSSGRGSWVVDVVYYIRSNVDGCGCFFNTEAKARDAASKFLKEFNEALP